MVQNEKKIIDNGFRYAYNQIDFKRGKKIEFKTEAAKALNVSQRYIEYYISGDRPMSPADWQTIKPILEKYGAKDIVLGNDYKKRNGIVRIQDEPYYDEMLAFIENEIRDMWRDETRTFTIDYTDVVFEVKVSVADSINGERIITLLDINGGDGKNKFLFDKLIKTIFETKY